MNFYLNTLKNWISIKNIQNEKINLFCFPYAGGGSSEYYKWSHYVTDNISICPVHLPGRERRIQEKPFENLNLLVDNIYSDLGSIFEKPCVFLGHSMGAQIAYKLAAKCEKEGSRGIKFLAVSGRKPPHMFNEIHQYHRMSDYDFIERLKAYGGTNKEFFQNKELVDLFLPMLRADFKMLETYNDTEHSKLNIPIYAFGGVEDFELPEKNLMQWANYSSDEFQHYMFSGGHFFIRKHVKEIINIISEKTEKYIYKSE